jgi:hypothetical protein
MFLILLLIFLGSKTDILNLPCCHQEPSQNQNIFKLLVIILFHQNAKDYGTHPQTSVTQTHHTLENWGNTSIIETEKHFYLPYMLSTQCLSIEYIPSTRDSFLEVYLNTIKIYTKKFGFGFRGNIYIYV